MPDVRSENVLTAYSLVIFVDEAAFVSSRMYTAGILPVAQQRYTTTILTTTPKKDGSFVLTHLSSLSSG